MKLFGTSDAASMIQAQFKKLDILSKPDVGIEKIINKLTTEVDAIMAPAKMDPALEAANKQMKAMIAFGMANANEAAFNSNRMASAKNALNEALEVAKKNKIDLKEKIFTIIQEFTGLASENTNKAIQNVQYTWLDELTTRVHKVFPALTALAVIAGGVLIASSWFKKDHLA